MNLLPSVLFWVFVGCTVNLSDNCLASTLLSNSVPQKVSRSMCNTNDSYEANVGWVILSNLESIVDVRCGLLTISIIRQNQQCQVNKGFCIGSLRDAQLSEAQLQEEISNLFRYATSLLEYDGLPLTNVLQEVSQHLANKRDGVWSEFVYRCRPLLTSPPAEENYVTSCNDVRDVMTNEEKYKYMLIYAYYKTVLMKVFSSLMEKNMLKGNNPDYYNSEFDDKGTGNACGLMEKELNFLSSVITNKHIFGGFKFYAPLGNSTNNVKNVCIPYGQRGRSGRGDQK